MRQGSGRQRQPQAKQQVDDAGNEDDAFQLAPGAGGVGGAIKAFGVAGEGRAGQQPQQAGRSARGVGEITGCGGSEQREVKAFAARKAEFDGDGAFADSSVAVNVAHIVDVQHRGGEQAAAGRGQQHRRGVAAALQVIAADDAEQAEEAENTDFAEGVVAVSVATHGVGDGGEDGERAEQQEQQQLIINPEQKLL